MSLSDYVKRLNKTCWNFIPYRESRSKAAPVTSPRSALPPLAESKSILERLLKENMLPFWESQIIDKENGGYRLHHDKRAHWKGPTNKRLVTQARTLWFFSRLINAGYGNEIHQMAAQHGFDFIHERMQDWKYGGFFWEVIPNGKTATMEDKDVYGHAFALLAFSEFAIASGSTSVKVAADRLFNLLEERFHDQSFGGYRQFFCRDWSQQPFTMKSYLGAPTKAKSMNSHLHLMEAMITYHTLSKERVAHQRLVELITIQSNAVILKPAGICGELYYKDWTPFTGGKYDRVSYGHNVQNVHLLMQACNEANLSFQPLLEVWRTIFKYCLNYGYDEKAGGFYSSGPFNERPEKREKVWWVQAECLLGALEMYFFSKNIKYLSCFLQTLDWIENYQADWEYGDWHAEILSNGRPWGDKAGAWKSAYHNGRAVIRCLELLTKLTESYFDQGLKSKAIISSS